MSVLCYKQVSPQVSSNNLPTQPRQNSTVFSSPIFTNSYDEILTTFEQESLPSTTMKFLLPLNKNLLQTL